MYRHSPLPTFTVLFCYGFPFFPVNISLTQNNPGAGIRNRRYERIDLIHFLPDSFP